MRIQHLCDVHPLEFHPLRPMYNTVYNIIIQKRKEKYNNNKRPAPWIQRFITSCDKFLDKFSIVPAHNNNKKTPKKYSNQTSCIKIIWTTTAGLSILISKEKSRPSSLRNSNWNENEEKRKGRSVRYMVDKHTHTHVRWMLLCVFFFLCATIKNGSRCK